MKIIAIVFLTLAASSSFAASKLVCDLKSEAFSDVFEDTQYFWDGSNGDATSVIVNKGLASIARVSGYGLTELSIGTAPDVNDCRKEFDQSEKITSYSLECKTKDFGFAKLSCLIK